jgi:serine/threonine protein phosphatase PrpC
VARAIGSAHIKRDPSKRALVPTPEVHSVQLQPEDDFVVLATDGLWDKVCRAAGHVAEQTVANQLADAQPCVLA